MEHGLPSRDELTVLTLGNTWTDQQWGAQLIAYGTHALGGHALLAVVTATAVVGAFAIAAIGARKLGAGPRAILLVFFPVILAAPWAWTMRAQVFALPLFTGLVWLLASEARNPTRRVFLVFPMLVVWANLHGSVALAAMLTMLLGVIELVRSRGRSARRSALLVALPPLAVLATPYGPFDTADYYRLLLLDPPFPRDLVTEWRASDPGTDTLLFYALAAAALVVVGLGRRRVTLFDALALAVTFVGALTAIRGIPWFALACMVLLPVAIGRTLEGKAPRRPRRWTASSRSPQSACSRSPWRSLSSATKSGTSSAGPTTRWSRSRRTSPAPTGPVYATSRDADWMLWRIPELRGRLAHDVRFEIFDRVTFERIVRFRGEQGDNWKSVTNGYDVVVLETGTPEDSHVPDFLAEPGVETLYQDERITVIRRAPSA